MNDRIVANELIKLARLLYAFNPGEEEELTLEKKKLLDNTISKFKEYGEKLVKDSKGKVLELIKKQEEVEKLTEELKEFYEGRKEIVDGKKIKVEGWKDTSGYHEFKKNAIEVLQQNMKIGEKLVFLADILEAKKEVSQRATPAEQLKILLSLTNAETQKIWEKEVENMIRCNTEIKGVITAMNKKFVDYTDEAKEIAKKRGLELKSSSRIAFSLTDLFNKFVYSIKNIFEKAMSFIEDRKDENINTMKKLNSIVKVLV